MSGNTKKSKYLCNIILGAGFAALECKISKICKQELLK